jgi:predicted DNA-binding protein (UPF0278 family)
MNKTQIVVYIEPEIYFKMLSYAHKNGCKTMSIATNLVLKEHFKGIDEQKEATERLNKVIQRLEDELQNRELEIRMLKKAKVVKDESAKN